MNLLKKVEKAHDEMFDTYQVKLRYVDKCLGQVAEDLDARMAKVDAMVRAGKMPEEVAESIRQENRERYRDAEKAKELGEPAEADGAKDAEKQMKNIFWRDDRGLYIESRIVKSAIKDILSQLGVFQKERGSKGAHNLGFYVENEEGGDRLYFTDAAGDPKQAADGVLTMPVHISGPTGKHSAITVSEFMERACLSFNLKLIKGAKLKEPALIRAFALLKDAGLSGKRSQGFGKIEYLAIEKT